MTITQLLNDQRFLFRDIPTEDVTIAGEVYPCICLSARSNNDIQIGGLSDLPILEIGIERSKILALPRTGSTLAFRSTTYRVGEVIHDHPQSPIRILLESTAK
jgi:hypothetical protein